MLADPDYAFMHACRRDTNYHYSDEDEGLDLNEILLKLNTIIDDIL